MGDTNDKVLRQWIIASIRKALSDYLGDTLTPDEKTEVWLNKKAVCEQFGFTPSWFDKHCQFLPRRKAEGCKYVYPRNKIQQMFKDKKIESIVTERLFLENK